MKKAVSAILCCGMFYSAGVQAFTPTIHEIQFELEVASCPEGIISLTQLEYPFLKGAPLSVSIEDFEQSFVEPMKALSPSRADVLRRFSAEMWRNLKTISGAALRPRLPTTTLFHRSDCVISVVAAITATASSISGVLNSDLWSNLSLETKNILVAEAYFHFERTAWLLQAFAGNQSWNPTRSRFFLVEWLTIKSRPKDLASFFALAVRAELAFIEQSGVLVPLGPVSPEWNETTGFVRISHTGYRSDLWKSQAVLKSSASEVNYPYNGWLSPADGDHVLFYADGSIHCLPWVPGYAIKQVGISDIWSGRLCVFPNGSVESGYLVVPWAKPATWQFGSAVMTIDRDPLAGGSDQGTLIGFFPDLKIRYIRNARGTVMLQGQSVEVRGPLLFEKVHRLGAHVVRLACASLPEKTSWLDNKGGRIVVKSRADTYCFDEQERVSSHFYPRSFPNF